jgi:hypothetical protein
MNKIILSICLAMIMTGSFGQTLNLRFGPSFSNLNWNKSGADDYIFDEGIIGFNFLLGLDYLDFRYFNLTSNIGILQKGGTGSLTDLQNPEGITESSATTILNYVTFNTMFVAKLPVKDRVVPFIHIGPRLDYLVSYSQTFNLFSQFTETDQLNKTMYGLVAGAGVDFKIKRFKIGIVVDYYKNFNKIVDYTSDSGKTDQIDDHTFTLNFQAGYKF